MSPQIQWIFSGFQPHFRLEREVRQKLNELSRTLPQQSFDFNLGLEKTEYGFHCKISAYSPIQLVNVEASSDSPRDAIDRALEMLGARLGAPGKKSPRWFQSRIWVPLKRTLHPFVH